MDKKYFSRAGNLDENFFKRPGDIPETPRKNTLRSIDNIEEYLLKVVSGKKYDYVCELGTLVGGGNTIVDINRLQEMVNSGFNIISAEYINDNMIMVEFQEFRKDTRGIRR
ncbi:MAG: hypothetical protein IJE89_03385 [Bacilli bacterium]|nr:hypothetical protein [Bacilli bacterium]